MSNQPYFINSICNEFKNYQMYKDHYEYMLNYPFIQTLMGKVKLLEEENKKLVSTILNNSLNGEDINEFSETKCRGNQNYRSLRRKNNKSSGFTAEIKDEFIGTNYKEIINIVDTDELESSLNFNKNLTKQNKNIDVTDNNFFPSHAMANSFIKGCRKNTVNCEGKIKKEKTKKKKLRNYLVKSQENILPSHDTANWSSSTLRSEESLYNSLGECAAKTKYDFLGTRCRENIENEPSVTSFSEAIPKQIFKDSQEQSAWESQIAVACEDNITISTKTEDHNQEEVVVENNEQEEEEEEEEVVVENQDQEEEEEVVGNNEQEEEVAVENQDQEQEEVVVENNEEEEQEEVVENNEEEEEEVYSVIINGKEYYTVNEENGAIFNEDLSVEIGKFIKGKPHFYKLT